MGRIGKTNKGKTDMLHTRRLRALAMCYGVWSMRGKTATAISATMEEETARLGAMARRIATTSGCKTVRPEHIKRAAFCLHYKGTQ